MKLFLLLPLLLAGCVVVGTPHITEPIEGQRVTARVCTIGNVDRQAVTAWHDRIGVDVEYVDLPANRVYEGSARERAALRFASVLPCQIVIEKVGGELACVLVACEAGFTYARRSTLDAAVVYRLYSVLEHELSHAWGCDHGWDEATCRAQISYLKAQL